MSPKRKVTRHVRPLPAPAAARTVTAASDRFVRRRRRRGVAIGLFVLAPVIALTHILEHLGKLQVMSLSPAAQDIFIGWPTAFVLLIIGGILWG
jgi:hypothetical protein